ncbi:hypothetical protein bas11_0054 [Escherichia phage JohannLBurckhardt]|uniref:Uncharacterized protein n=1 Tax=Escherichia phage JohannLBurckhardt TaxID=2851975 RepID=A0AAE7VUR1_9CAUD|nr:hypothetical protein bas11_0054 [Escherichia phage JohannLBurckhardt]
MQDQIDAKVIRRNPELTPGIFKKGIEITIDLEEMVCYHSGLTWKVKQLTNTLWSLAGDEHTVMEVI